MKREMLILCGVLAAVSGIALFADALPSVFAEPAPAPPGCDKLAASASVGSCTSDLSACSDASLQADCTGDFAKNYEWKNDFPTSCVTSNNNNCNMPSQQCYRKTPCKWTAGATPPCTVDTNGVYGIWIEVGKRTTVACP